MRPRPLRAAVLLVTLAFQACGSDDSGGVAPRTSPSDEERAACEARGWKATSIERGGWWCLPAGYDDCLATRGLMTSIAGNSYECMRLAASQSQCEELGGEVILTAGHYTACLQDTTDAGKPCDDTAQCEGYCEAPRGSQEGDPVDGTCSRRTLEECFMWVRDGIAGAPICI
jgi:hypothetical protein